ncbi:phosphatidate cytidylyltransferase [Mycoplasma sp. Z386]
MKIENKWNCLLKNKILVRTIVVLLIFLILFPSFFSIYFLGIGGRIFGLLFFIVLSSYGSYEILKNFKIKKLIFIPLIVLSNMTYFLSIDNFLSIVKDGINHFEDLISYLTLDLETGIFLISLFILLLIISFIDKETQNVFNYILIYLVLSSISLFGKYLFIFNVYSVYAVLIIGFIAGISDTFGLFGGSLLGNKIFKRKLAPKISPKKTWEGAIISVLFSGIFTFCCLYFSSIFPFANNEKIIFALVMSLILPIASILGDLLFSLIKRHLSIKDFSNLLPNHGGIMDRFDSTFLVLFCLVIGILIINIF